jgi:hypothetical protein
MPYAGLRQIRVTSGIYFGGGDKMALIDTFLSVSVENFSGFA